ncbi:MAG: DUF1858 domain-containing protein [Melioribacteraceae bacterium]|nr:DUF1858 domain-containing protein [Melioribacteraceae bacterium]
MNKPEITPQTLVADLLSYYPELEEKLIEISPVFSKLKNPVLRKTVAKVTNLKQAATIANISISEMINKLRKEVNQIEIEIREENQKINTKPLWVINENIKVKYDATLDLENGIHPAAKVTKEILELKNEEIYLLITPFVPAPLIKIIEEKGFEVFTEKLNDSTIYNFIKRK